MRYTQFTIHFKEGDEITFTDVKGVVMYDLKYPDSGALLVEKCDGKHAPQLPQLGGDVRQLMRDLEEVVEQARNHEHEFVVMYAPGTWTRVDFRNV